MTFFKLICTLPGGIVVIPKVEEAFEHGCHIVTLSRERVDEGVAELALAEDVFTESAEHLRDEEVEIYSKFNELTID